jgi:hypothetical protein
MIGKENRWKNYYIRQEEKYRQLLQSKTYLDYPRAVSIETYAWCNAGCNFCPYSSLDRRGVKMPADLVYKIIDELSNKRTRSPRALMFYRVNEPFLDKRIFAFLRYAQLKLTGCTFPQTTNGSVLNDRVLDRLLGISNIPSIKISVNECDPYRYERVMQLPYTRTVRNLDRLHERKKVNEIVFRIILGRVGNGTDQDDKFLEWCSSRYPLFEAKVSRPFDWRGAVEDVTVFEPPDTGCTQWFELHILADGTEAFCCIDVKGTHPRLSAATTNVLDIYNRPSRRILRESAISRSSVSECSGCTY